MYDHPNIFFYFGLGVWINAFNIFFDGGCNYIFLSIHGIVSWSDVKNRGAFTTSTQKIQLSSIKNKPLATSFNPEPFPKQSRNQQYIYQLHKNNDKKSGEYRIAAITATQQM